MIFIVGSVLAMTAWAAKLTDNNHVFLAKPGSVIEINLQSNATTGYAWFLAHYNHKRLQPISHQYLLPNAKLIGASGVERWRFRILGKPAIVPEIVWLELDYLRPWDLTDVTRKHFAVTILPKSS